MSESTLSGVIRALREAHHLGIRELAAAAEVSHTQVSRIESGETATPSREIVVRLAKALRTNPAPLLILAGHLRGDRARVVLAQMLRPGAELIDAWNDPGDLSAETAATLVRDARSPQEQLMRVAATALMADESEEILWDPSDIQYLTLDGDDELELIGIWRYLHANRRKELLRYGRALRELEDLDFLAGLDALSSDLPQAAKPVVAFRFAQAALKKQGFAGFKSVKSLCSSTASVPRASGVYMVLRANDEPVHFLDRSAGGSFKGRDPSLELSRLTSEWVANAEVVYIGRAGNLQRRIEQLVRFGQGQPIGHWGGRALWHLSDHQDLVIAWQPHADPVGREAELLAAFRAQYGRLPFANLRTVNT